MKCPVCLEGELLPSAGGAPRCDRCGVLDFDRPQVASVALPSLLYQPRPQGEPPTPLDSPVRGAYCLDPALDAARRGGPRGTSEGLSSDDVVDLAAEVLVVRLGEIAPDIAARVRLEDLAICLAVPLVVEARPGRKATFHRVLELDLEGVGCKGKGWLLGYTLERKKGEVPREAAMIHTAEKVWGVPRWGAPETSFDNADLVQLAGRRLHWIDG